MHTKNGIKKKDITEDAIAISKIEDTMGYQVIDSTDEDAINETASNYGDSAEDYWSNADEKRDGIGSWFSIMPAKLSDDGTTVTPANSEGIISDEFAVKTVVESTTSVEDIPPKDSHTVIRVANSSSKLGIAVACNNHKRHDTVFFPLGTSSQIFRDVGSNVELLESDGETGTGKMYTKETLDGSDAFHTSTPPYATGRRYIGIIKKEADEGEDAGVALLDLQGHGSSDNDPL